MYFLSYKNGDLSLLGRWNLYTPLGQSNHSIRCDRLGENLGFLLKTSREGWNTNMTKFLTYFFLLMNAAISLMSYVYSRDSTMRIDQPQLIKSPAIFLLSPVQPDVICLSYDLCFIEDF